MSTRTKPKRIATISPAAHRAEDGMIDTIDALTKRVNRQAIASERAPPRKRRRTEGRKGRMRGREWGGSRYETVF